MKAQHSTPRMQKGCVHLTKQDAFCPLKVLKVRASTSLKISSSKSLLTPKATPCWEFLEDQNARCMLTVYKSTE